MISDMKTFTVRDLDRSPATVLEASRVDGKVRVRERGGQTYIITPERAPDRRITHVPDLAGRRDALLGRPLPQAVVDKLDRAIAGE